LLVDGSEGFANKLANAGMFKRVVAFGEANDIAGSGCDGRGEAGGAVGSRVAMEEAMTIGVVIAKGGMGGNGRGIANEESFIVAIGR